MPYTANGPLPRPVTHTANAEIRQLEIAAPAMEKRTAPQMMNGNRAKPRTAPMTAVWRNRNTVAASRHATRRKSSPMRFVFNSAKLTIRGTRRRHPSKSPTHHTTMAEVRPSQTRIPARKRTEGPIKALIAVPTPAKQVSLRTSLRRQMRFNDFLCRSVALTSGASVLPTVIARVALGGLGAKKLTRKAPAAIPGQT